MSNTEQPVEIEDCWNKIGIWGNIQPKCEKLKTYIHCRNCDIFSSSSKIILNRKIPDGYQDEWAKEFSKEKKNTEYQPNSALVFRVRDEWIAMPTEYIQEITSMSAIHKIPHKEGKYIKGLVNVRGELKICISLAAILNLNKALHGHSKRVGENLQYQRLVVIQRNGHDFVFPVTEIQSLIRYNRMKLLPVPSTVNKAQATYTEGVIKQSEKKIACIMPENLFDSLEKCLK